MNTIKKILSIGFLIICCAVGYYLVWVLPAAETGRQGIEKEQLQFMQEKQVSEKNQGEKMAVKREALKEKTEANAKERHQRLLECLADVKRQRNDYVKHNSKPSSEPEQALLTSDAVTHLQALVNEGDANCTRMYEEK